LSENFVTIGLLFFELLKKVFLVITTKTIK